MTTSTNTPRLTYLTSDGSTVNFTFNFEIADQNSIAVYVGTTLKTLTTDYTVSFDSGTSGTGTITLNSAPAINTRVYLIRDTYNVRSTDFAQGGAFLAQTINNELDRITQGIQDVDNIVADKVLRVAEPTVETATLTLPAAATRASKTLGFDASGNVTVLTIGSGTVDSVGLSTSDANITLGGTNPVTGTGTITVNLTNPLVKNLTGDVTGNLTGNVTATTGTSTFNDVIVNGDLTVEGTTTTINTATLNVEDNIIKLATNQSGAPAVNAGIEIERGSSTDKSLIWDEAVDKWTIGSDTFVAGTVEANLTGNVSGNVTGNLTGNADSATYASAVTLTADNSTNATNYLLFSNAVSGNQSPRTDTGLTYNPGTNTLTGGTFSGVFSGTLVGGNDYITLVGDDSTGVNVTLGETFKIAGGSNITTAVTGDTLTINGSNPAQGIIFVGDDSTGTQIGDGETVKIAGGNNITTAMSGDILTITGSKTIDVNEISSGDSSAIQINDAVNISGTLSANVLDVNEISSSDSTAIQINNAVNVSGTLSVSGNVISNVSDPVNNQDAATKNYVDSKVSANNTLTIADDTSTTGSIDLDNTLQVLGGNNITTSISGDTLTISGDKSIDVNEINSGDSSAIQINDAVNVSGTLTANTFATNEISSSESSAIQINDSVNISGTLNAKTIVTNDLISEDSTAIQVLDGLGVSGDLSVTGDITTADSLQFNTTAGEATAAGKLYYNSDYGTLAHGLGDGSEIFDGVDLVAYVTNAEATTLNRGEVVYIFGASGDRPSVKRADNSGDPTSSKTLGIVKDDITAGNAGYVMTQGIVTGLNTATYTAGDILWLGTSGAFTATKPTHPAHLVFVGVVLRANAGNGLVYVKPQNGYELDELHDVNAGTAVANDILKYDGSAWVNTPGGELIYNGNSITAASNADIDITAGGTGNINLNADTIRLGDSGANATVTTNGAGDIIINTNSGTNSGSITIADGANGNIDLVTDGTGKVNINKVLSAANYPFTPISTNFPAYDSASIRGTTILFSDLAIPNITTDAGKYRVNNRIISTKADSSGTTYNNTAFLIQNTDITLFDLNGATASGITSRGTGVRGQATNCILTNSGGGTKTSPNIFGGNAFTEIVEGHGGDLTVPNAIGHRSVNSIRANTGETTRVTNVFGYVADATLTAGTGALATRVITNDYGFYASPATTTNVSTNYYGFFVNSGGGATNRYGVYVNNSAYSNLLGGLTIVSNQISSSSNANIEIAPDGTGDVYLTADTVRVGDSNADVTVTTNGTGDLILNTNSGTNSGNITIADGANGNISITPNGTGDVILSADTVQVGDAAATATITTNGAGDLVLNTNAGSNSGNITITQGLNGNISITPNGTGDVILSADTVQVGDSAAAATITSNGAGNLILQTGAASTGNITINQGTNANISITPHGTGAVVIDGSSWPTADGPNGYVLTTNGAGQLSWALAGTGDLVITGTTISAGTTNADITITSTGTGNVNLDVDTVRIGDLNTDANITTNGTGDLILSTNSTTNSGSIRIYDGTGGNIEINPYVDLQLITNKVIVGESNASPIITTNGTGNLSLTANGNAATSANAYVTVDTDGDVNINAAQVSEANRSVYVTLGDSRSTSSDVGKLFVNTITNSPEIETNIIRSNDSSAIQIDDAVNVSGAVTLHGTTRFNSCYTEKINSLTSSTTITVNANLAPVHKVTLGTNTEFVITNLPTGGSLSLIIVQDGTGSRTATFGTDTSTAVKFPGGVATLSTAANAIDIVNIFNDGTNYYGLISKTFS